MEYNYIKEKFDNLINNFESRAKVRMSQIMDEIAETADKEDYITNYSVKGFINAHIFMIAISVVTKEDTLFLEIYEISRAKIEN